MRYAVKGMLWSGLLFPGAGQIALKRYRRGSVFILLVLILVTAVVSLAVKQANAVLATIESQGGVIDMNSITSAVAQVTGTTDSFIINIAFLLIVVLWLAGVIDAFLIGTKLDAAQQSTPDT